MQNKTEIIEVIILADGKTAREVNNATNPKMGKRHLNYETMLRTFTISKILIRNGEEDILDEFSKEQYGDSVKPNTKHQARVLPNNKIIII